MRRILHSIIILVLVPLSLAGCLEDVEEVPLDPQGEEISPPTGLAANAADGSIFLSWNASTGATSYNVYRQSGLEGETSVIANTPGTSYLDEDVTNGQQYVYSVSTINAAGIEGKRTADIYAVPSVYSILINGGVAVTGSKNIVLVITAPISTVLMKISNTASMIDADWETFSGTREWMLETGDGEKTVYAVFQDGNGSSSSVISKTVLLDTRAAITSVYFTPFEEKYPLGSTVLFILEVEDDETGGSARVELEGYSQPIELRDDGLGGDRTASDGSYESDFTFPGSYRGSELGVAGLFVDRAGNSALPFESPQMISFTDPPEAVELLAPIDSTVSSITLKWVESTEPDFLAYRIYRSTQPDVVTDSPEYFIRGLDNRSQTSYPDGSLKEGTTYYYKIFVVNDLGDETGSNERAARTFDAYPTPVLLESPTSVGTDRLTLTWSENHNTDFAEYRIYRSMAPGVTESSQLVAMIGDRELTWYDDTGLDLAGNTYYYRVIVFDESGKSSRSNEISTD